MMELVDREEGKTEETEFCIKARWEESSLKRRNKRNNYCQSAES